MDIAGLNITESLQTVASQAGNNGGNPSVAVLSLNAKQKLDIEQPPTSGTTTTWWR
jgi:hypothetical protein